MSEELIYGANSPTGCLINKSDEVNGARTVFSKYSASGIEKENAIEGWDEKASLALGWRKY